MDAQHKTSAAPGRQVARGAPHAARALAPQTARLYASGWAAFVAWCRAARMAPLPAEPRTVAAYLATLGHLSPGAAARRLAAISDQHRRAGLPVSTTAPGVRSALRQARRTAPPRRRTECHVRTKPADDAVRGGGGGPKGSGAPERPHGVGRALLCRHDRHRSRCGPECLGACLCRGTCARRGRGLCGTRADLPDATGLRPGLFNAHD